MSTPNPHDFNPYAAPTAEPSFAPDRSLGEQAMGSYYAMSVTKLWIMSILTFNLYNLVFFYRHWRHLRDHQHQSLSPFWRTVFAPLMYFGLNSEVSETARFRGVPVPALLGAAPILYFMIAAADRVLNHLVDETSFWVDLATFLIVPVSTYALTLTQTAANRILEHEGYAGVTNRGATAGSLIVGTLGALLWAVIAVSYLE